MSFSSSRRRIGPRSSYPRRPVRKPSLEALEDRALPSSLFTVTDLGTLGRNYSAAYGINASGKVVGWSSLSGDTVGHAALWSAGNSVNIQDLGTLGETSVAYAINASGQVAGDYFDAGGLSHAFLW